MPKDQINFIKLSLLAVILACAGALQLRGGVGEPGFPAISTNDLFQHIKILSSDEYEGRAPGSPGEEKTVAYLTAKFKEFGLAPGNPDGTFLQKVPLMGFTAKPRFTLTHGTGRNELAFPSECVIWSRRFVPEIKVTNSDVVFVGYGIVAPEYGWDDYKGVDVRGKTILMLVNDPPIPDTRDPSKLDDSMFKGRAMTYYGRWTYKYEIATEKGAAAAIVVHETGPAGYPFEVIMGSSSRENFDLQAADGNRNRVAVEGWVTLDQARKLCTNGGQDFDALKKSALQKDFRPVALRNMKATFAVTNTLREVASHNVVAKVTGTDPKLKDEYVIYTAHWDHIGRDPNLQGDQIYNGAVDNASGIATLLELARSFAKNPPKRSVLFLAVTAEEKGLLGSKYYAANPLYPLERTVANINMDSMNVWGRTRDVVVVGVGQSTLEDTLNPIVTAQDRVVLPEADPDKGTYFRSDHFEFAKQGVPALYLKSGNDFPGKPPGYGREKREEYVASDYHKLSDEIKPGWDLSGHAEDTRLLFHVGNAVAQGDKWPEWKAGSEFKARRDEMMKKAEPR